MSRLRFDHIAIAANTLDEGVCFLEEKLGFEIPVGGEHPKMGTHNRLLRLGDDLYLELIAINPLAAKPSHPRWFNLDNRKTGAPAISTWVINTDDMDGVLKHMPEMVGPAIDMKRDALEWRITVPDEGTMPMKGYHPTVIEWPEGVHPVSNMDDLGCRLQSFVIEHPEIETVRSSLAKKFEDERVILKQGKEAGFIMTLETPRGVVDIF